MMSFQYKTVLVLGATSGIGLALAEKLVVAGSHVIAVGRRKENLDKFVEAHGSEKVSAVQFDITNNAEIPKFVENIAKSHPKLDCVVMNSGIQRMLNFADPESIDLELVNTEFNTNYLSYIALTKYFLPFLQKQSVPTSIVFVTSGLALVPLMRCPNYSASKAALHHLILVMREQLAGSNVKVIEILPPAVQTELHDAKHQPDLGDKGRHIGIPLDEFTDAAWEGLVGGKEQIPVGFVNVLYKEDGFETLRQKAFQGLNEQMKSEGH